MGYNVVMMNIQKLFMVLLLTSFLVPVFVSATSYPLGSIPADQPSFIEKIFPLNSRYIAFGSSIIFGAISIIAIISMIIIWILLLHRRKKSKPYEHKY